jgi:hypothetical protein
MVPDQSSNLNSPPAVGPEWTAAERLAYIAWLARMTLHQIDSDNAAVPLLSKRPVRDLFYAVLAVAVRSAETLETDRPALMKRYDPAADHHGVHVPAEWLELLAELDSERG